MSIYDMKLHETLQITGFNITRVHGGWLYVRTNSMNSSPVFVERKGNAKEWEDENLVNN